MRVNGGIATRQRNTTWCRGNTERVAKEIRTRQLYAESRGINFESDTIVMKADKRKVCDPQAERESEMISDAFKKSAKRSRPRSSMSSYGKKSKGGSASGFFQRVLSDINSRDSASQPAKPKKWAEGISEAVPKEKKTSIERSLSWMEKNFEKDLSKPVESNAVPVSEKAEPQMSDALKSDVFRQIRQRVANMLLHDLPHEVTAELRTLGRELEQMSATVQ